MKVFNTTELHALKADLVNAMLVFYPIKIIMFKNTYSTEISFYISALFKVITYMK